MASGGEKKEREGHIPIGEWKVELRLATARIEGGGPLNVADECGGHCCRHGVYASLPARDRILEYADRICAVMDATQTTDTSEWFEDEVEEDEDYPGGLCIGTAIYSDKCAISTWFRQVEFDDLCDGVRPCCTLASDGPSRAIDAWAYEFKEVLGEEGYDELRRRAAELEQKQLGGRTS